MEMINWTKAEKPYPKKTQTVSSFLNLQSDKNKSQTQKQKLQNPFANSFSNIKKASYEDDSDESLSDEKSKRSNETSANKVSLKDLCDEDKQRIGNLVKELAKWLSEEKNQIEKTLEDEKKQRENELREMLKQQEYLLSDKEDLLNKLAKIHKKLADTKRQKKSESLVSKKESNALPPRPSRKKNSDLDEPKSKSKSSNEKKNIEDIFNPHKSSTPKNLSPRSLSPISIERSNFVANNRNCDTFESKSIEQTDNLNKFVTNDQHSEDLKKIELMKQRMELVDEQNKLKQLLEQQEEIIREKQSQIILQQKLHRERLEELSRLKEQNQVNVYDTNNEINQDFLNKQITSQQNEFIKTQMYNQNPNINYLNPSLAVPYYQYASSSPVHSQIQMQNYYQPDQVKKVELIQPTFNLNQQSLKRESLADDENLDGLATIVYEKLLLKKNSDNKLKSKLLNDKPLECSISNTSCTSSRQENDEYMIDLIIESTRKENENKLKVNQPKASNNKNSKKFSKEFQQSLNNDLEESKLIEELFFIK